MARSLDSRLIAGYNMLASSDDSFPSYESSPQSEEHELGFLCLRVLPATDENLQMVENILTNGLVSKQTHLPPEQANAEYEEPQRAPFHHTTQAKPYLSPQAKKLPGVDGQAEIEARLELANDRQKRDKRLITRTRYVHEHPRNQFLPNSRVAAQASRQQQYEEEESWQSVLDIAY